MPDQPIRLQCRHIFTEGRRCQSPCLRAQEFCYFHQANRPARRHRHDDPSAFILPPPEDRAAIQLALGIIIQRLAAAQLDPRRAGLLLSALRIASANLPKPARPTIQVEEVVEHPELGQLAPVEEYEEPTESTSISTGKHRGRSFVDILMDEWQPEPQHPTPIDLQASRADTPCPMHNSPSVMRGTHPRTPTPTLVCHSAAKRRNLPLTPTLRRRRSFASANDTPLPPCLPQVSVIKSRFLRSATE